MSALSVLQLAQEANLPGGAATGVGEAVAFWILGPVALAGAFGMVLARNAVHSALCLAGTMLSLGLLYMAQGADHHDRREGPERDHAVPSAAASGASSRRRRVPR